MLRITMMALTIAVGFLASISISVQAQDVTAAQAHEIAKEAYVYGFPLVDNYRIQYAFFIDSGNSQYKAPLNQIMSLAGLATPADTAVQTPNSDTLYSLIGLDLRTEPFVLTIPSIEKDRYFSVQLIDWYTFNFDYIGSRATGNDGGSFLIAGPSWKGETPAGVKKAFRSETEFVFANYRTQLFNPDDLDNVKKIQAGDGGLTFYVQNESPGKDKEPNWLPAPKGPFWVSMRLYWPKDEALDGTWKEPPMIKA